MPFNQVAGFKHAAGLVARELSVDDGMNRVIAWCRKKAPRSPVWGAAAKLDYAGSIPALRRWLEPMLRDAPSKVTGFYFGINEYSNTLGSRHFLDLYCVGFTSRPRIAKDEFPWKGSPDWNTESPTARSSIMRKLLPICRREGGGLEYGDAEYVLVSAYAGFALRALMREIPAETWLSGAKRRPVCTGFDAGEPMLVGIITPRAIK